MEELTPETVEFIKNALNYTPASDLDFMLEVTNASCTKAAFAILLLDETALEVTARAHAMRYDTDGHRYFSVALPGDAPMVPITRLHATDIVTLTKVNDVVRPVCDAANTWLSRVGTSVVRISRGNGDNWYVTRIIPGSLQANEPATAMRERVGERMSAAQAKELGFNWVYVPEMT